MKIFPALIFAISSNLLHGGVWHPSVVGIEIGLSYPVGDIRGVYTSDSGKNTGLLLEWDCGNGHGLRTDFGLTTTFPRKNKIIHGAENNYSLDSSCATFSYTYHFNGTNQGAYLLAGLGMKYFEASLNDPPFVSGGVLSSDPILTHSRLTAYTGLKLAYAVGFGWDFAQPVGVTFRCVGMQAMGHLLTTLETGIHIRF